MTGAHVMGVPLEESVLALAPAGAVMATAVAVLARNGLARMLMRLRRGRPPEPDGGHPGEPRDGEDRASPTPSRSREPGPHAGGVIPWAAAGTRRP